MYRMKIVYFVCDKQYHAIFTNFIFAYIIYLLLCLNNIIVKNNNKYKKNAYFWCLNCNSQTLMLINVLNCNFKNIYLACAYHIMASKHMYNKKKQFFCFVINDSHEIIEVCKHTYYYK